MARKTRLSIAGLMGVVLVASLGLTALRSGTEEWAGATTLVTCGVLALGLVGAACRSGTERAWWLGFSLFGWGYLWLVFLGPYTTFRLPTSALLEILRPTHASGGMGGGILGGMGVYNRYDAHSQAAHSLFGLAAAAIGGVLAVFLFGRLWAGPRVAAGPVTEAHVPRKRWRRYVVGSVAMVAGATAVLAGLRWAPEFSCCVTMYATWGLLGLSAVGAVCRTGRARAAWLGAALFGIGYMALIFGRDPQSAEWPKAGTDLMLRALRPSWSVSEAPPSTASAAATNAWIRDVLQRPVTLHHPEETSLDDLLKAIQAVVRSQTGRGLSFYVDPIGLQEAEKTLQSSVAHPVFRGDGLRSNPTKAPRTALPRRRTLCTNSKNPR
jgi:hypothetical protein